jgi:hypothetical protein
MKECLIGWNASHRLAFSGDAGRAYAERGGSNLMISGAGNTWGSWGATKINNSQLKSAHKSYQNGALNLGNNYELFPFYNYTTKQTKMRKMPNRGVMNSVIKY